MNCFKLSHLISQDDVKEIEKIADFVGRPASRAIYSQIAEACRFEKLKHASENIKDQTFHNRWREGSSGYFRKGEMPIFKKEMQPEWWEQILNV